MAVKRGSQVFVGVVAFAGLDLAPPPEALRQLFILNDD
ncbi:hypothetical protein RTBOTA2_001108 [Rhodotorula toruloides]|nr:hypothetical protein RTBOTA2_001108 [Rhodotorula toruloides]